MIERLAARLETAPDDVNGWRMLGWSYFNTERYDEAVKAYAKAVELDPNSDELKSAYEQAKAKASGSENSSAAAAPQPGSVGADAAAPSTEKAVAPEAKTQHMGEAQIRAMVDGLAARLESSPRDAEGWARLMRSRVVLGEREVAATAFRRALDVFKDDAAASARITEAASELGLKAE
jgi:cytochrome c-type biogenesis protein CcmH